MNRDKYYKMINQIKSKVNTKSRVITERDLLEIIQNFNLDKKSTQALMDYLDANNIMIDREKKPKETPEDRLDSLEEDVNDEERSTINEIVNENSKIYEKIFNSLVSFLEEKHVSIPSEEIVRIAGKIDIYDCELSDVERIISSDFKNLGILEQIDDSKLKALAKKIYINIP